MNTHYTANDERAHLQIHAHTHILTSPHLSHYYPFQAPAVDGGRYLQYNNTWTGATLQQEKWALRNAMLLARFSNRRLILPAFHCHKCRSTQKNVKQNVCINNPKDRCPVTAHFNVKRLFMQFPGEIGCS
jgi:hypothetical protein